MMSNNGELRDVWGGQGKGHGTGLVPPGPLTSRFVPLLALAFALACGDAPAAKPDSAGATAAAPAAAPAAPPEAASIPEPTPAPVDLSKLRSNIPKASTDTFTFRPLRVEQIPDAPQALMDAAERERGISRFCYQEFGQKVNPKLTGAVALVVTVEGNAITAARIGADDWSSDHGKAVDRCLVQKVPQAWKLLPDANVKDGLYVVQLQFRPS